MLAAKRQEASKGEADKGKVVRRKPEATPSLPINPLWHHLATRVPGVQAKLQIGQPGDRYEQEADRVAEQVMRMPEPSIRRKPSCPFVDGSRCGDDELNIQTKPAGEGNTVAQVNHPAIQNVLSSSGQPLDSGTRSFMEPRFGQDFSGVRVYTGGQAAESARAVNARAYTVGRNVVFGEGQYAPDTSMGRRLIAHELTHTIQQGDVNKSPSSGTSPFSENSGFQIRQFDQDPKIAKEEEARVPVCPEGTKMLPCQDIQHFFECYGTDIFCVSQTSISVSYTARWTPSPGPSTGQFRTQIRDLHSYWLGRTSIWNVGDHNDHFSVPHPGAYWLRYEVINPNPNPRRRKRMEVTSNIYEP